MPRQIWMSAMLFVLPAALAAQTAISTTKNTVTTTATIDAIDHTARTITLKDRDGEVETVTAGPEVKRFNELKVGDTVTMRYYESVVYVIKKADASATPAPTDKSAITPGTGGTPGGTVARQVTETVTITAIDPSVPSVTVKTPEGHTVTRKVKDPKHLAGLAVGDRVDVTYTQALLVHVEPAGDAARP